MRQLAKWLGKGFSLGMLVMPWLLIVTLAFCWVRSHYYSDNFILTQHRVSGGLTHGNILSALTTRGNLSLTWERGTTDVPDAATKGYENLRYRAFPDGMLMWHNIPHSGMERLGFYWVDRPKDFIFGFLSVSARYTSVMVPIWLLMLLLGGFSALQILARRWWRRRWLRVRGSFPAIPSEPVTPAQK